MTSDAQKAYVLPVNDDEWARLDAQHNGIAAYLDNKLSPADLGQPKKILEIGAGSGAWAIQAAKQYPDADILAVDMNPLPARPLPPNVRFQQLNVLEPFPFPAESFDVVHTRLVLCHLPDGHSVLSRMIDLVAPGGWLLIDDIDWSAAFEGLDKAPGIKGGLASLVKSMEVAGASPHYGKTLKPYLESSDRLTDVHVNEVDLSFNPLPKEPALATLSQMMKKALVTALGAAPISPQFPKEKKEAFLDEVNRDDLEWQYSMQLYFAWAQKRA